MMLMRDGTLFENYLETTKSRVFKILPLLEERNEGVFRYIDSLLFELYGIQYVVQEIKDSTPYLSVLATLESILDETIVETKDFKFIRSEIFKTITLIERLQKGE